MTVRSLLLALCCILFLSYGGYAMIMTLPLEELAGEAEIIAVGTLKITTKLPKDKDGWVKIQNTVTLSEVLKGSAKAGDEVVVETLEGMEDMPVFEPRNRFILFLNKSPNGPGYVTTNLIQGYWPMDTDGKFAGMGLGVTMEQLKKAMEKGPAPKPSQPADSSTSF
jgi:hypothetical protein